MRPARIRPGGERGRRSPGRPRILVLNCYSDNHAHARGSPLIVPQSIAPATLAGMLDAEQVELRLACEFRDGPFSDREALAAAELLVLTGLNPSFDRMKQVTALARTVNPRIAVAMGGPLARVLPRLSRRYFDYVCEADVEQIVDVVDALFGPGHAAADPLPRYDLMPGKRIVGYAESSRNCNFRCSFCAMTAEGRRHQPYATDYLRRQIEAMGYRQCVMLLDQNFHAGARAILYERLALLREMHRERRFGGWAALVTADFFADPERLRLAREAGCIGFFSGVESFSAEQIAAYNKKQNLVLPQEEIIRGCLEAGMVFHYGLVFDPGERRLADLIAETEFIVGNPRITLPSFLSFTIPLLGTPLFRERLRAGALLPDIRLRDMDGRSLLCHPLDTLADARAFAARMDRGLIDKGKLARHALAFCRHYRKTLTRWGLVSGLGNALTMAWPRLGTNGRDRLRAGRPGARSYVAGEEAAGSLYRPPIPLAERFRGHFEALRVTDANGELHADLAADEATLLGSATPTHDANGIPAYNPANRN